MFDGSSTFLCNQSPRISHFLVVKLALCRGELCAVTEAYLYNLDVSLYLPTPIPTDMTRPRYTSPSTPLPRPPLTHPCTPPLQPWLVKTRRAPSRHSTDARFYGHTTTAVHTLNTTPSPPTLPSCPQCYRPLVSPLITAPYHTDAPPETSTSPIRVALGATQALSATEGAEAASGINCRCRETLCRRESGESGTQTAESQQIGGVGMSVGAGG